VTCGKTLSEAKAIEFLALVASKEILFIGAWNWPHRYFVAIVNPTPGTLKIPADLRLKCCSAPMRDFCR
jgi:hypothetical protein